MDRIRQQNIENMVSFFQEGCKTQFYMGLELEHFVVDSQNALLPYSGEKGIAVLLEQLLPFYDKSYISDGNLIGLSRKDCAVSIEPAGQLEISISPQQEVKEMERIYRQFHQEVTPILEKWNASLQTYGYLPKGKVSKLELLTKKRYQYMDAYFATIGEAGRQMMRGTAAAQVSIDYRDEEDFIKKYEAAYMLNPFFAWITDNVPVFENEPNHQAMIRSRIWTQVDKQRTNVFSYLKGRPLDFHGYAEFVYDTPLIVAHEKEEDIFTKDTPAQYYQHRIMEPEDIGHILSMVFPCVRLKKVLEVRGGDSMPIEACLGYAAMIKRLLYQPQIALDWLKDMGICRVTDANQLEMLMMEQKRGDDGGNVYFGKHSVKDMVENLFALARGVKDTSFAREDELLYIDSLKKHMEERYE